METAYEDHMEGYLRKRFRSGMVKTMKKKWCVLKDKEIRWYESKEACQQNVEVYQDILPVSRLQTVRLADNHGLEVVTQQHVFILVASCEEDQKRWIKAIHESMKDNRPRSVSNPENEGVNKDPEVKRKRSSSNPKVSISRIISGLQKKSSTDRRSRDQSQFFVEQSQEQPSFAEIGVQADVQKPVTSERCKRVDEGDEIEPREETELADDVFERQDATSQSSESTPSQQKTEVDKSVDGEPPMVQESSLHLDSDPLPSEDPGRSQVSENHGQSVSDSEEVASSEIPTDLDLEHEDGVQQLELMLRMSSSSEDGQQDSEEIFGSDANDDEVETDDDFHYEETEDGHLNKTHDGISAFEELEALLRKF